MIEWAKMFAPTSEWLREIFFSRSFCGWGGILVPLKRNRISENIDFFLDTEGKLVVLDLAFICGKMVRLVGIYVHNIGQRYYFRDSEKFLGTLHLLTVLGDFNVGHGTCVDSAGSKTDSRVYAGFHTDYVNLVKWRWVFTVLYR